MLELLKNYIEKRISLLKLEMAENTTKAMSLALYLLLVLIFVACVFAFLFLGLALIIGHWLGHFAYGFLLISGFFLLCLLGIISQKNKLLEYFKEKFIRTIFNEE